MSDANYKEIIWNGVWKNNAGIVALLGLCPLLAVSTTVVNGVGLGVATIMVMACSNAIVSLVRQWVPGEIRIPVYILIIAVLVTVIDLAMNAYMQALYLVLGIFVPLIVVNCNVLGRAEAFASKNPVFPSMVDGFMVGLGLTMTLAVLGGMREIIGKGTLLSGIDLAFGESAKAWVITVIPDYHGFLLAILPPGAFIGLGLLIAGKNWLDQRQAAKGEPVRAPEASAATA
ncbi:electron transport complex subunit E [Sulfurimicrobium lacus]|uniref:Ion-translocating oxidoreductase complex subunit E n=1 Tax=Sulfurimicrobium lacus TaxID=2715678 RepID=A0A6F8VAQ1_9PROT|nr:electron transport complex subunit E [Sulfurimicrobium lacus]BCB26923.1 electron transport complex subunit E [Sulfurimicrobium lacus]